MTNLHWSASVKPIKTHRIKRRGDQGWCPSGSTCMNDLCIHESGSWMKLYNLMKDDYDLSWCNGWLRSSVKVLFNLFDIPKLSIQHLSTAVLVSMITDSFFAVAWCFFNVPSKVCLHVMWCVLGRTPCSF